VLIPFKITSTGICLPSILYRYVNCYGLPLHRLGWIHHHALNYQVGGRIRGYYGRIGRTRIVKGTPSKISLELKRIGPILIEVTIKIPFTKISYITITYSPCIMKAPGLICLVPSPAFQVIIPCAIIINLSTRPVDVIPGHSGVLRINKGTIITVWIPAVKQFCIY